MLAAQYVAVKLHMKENISNDIVSKPFWRHRAGYITLRILLFFILLLVVGYLGFAAYIHTHKKEVLQQVTEALNNEINGTMTIGEMEPTFLQGFPRISIHLKNIVIRDSLYKNHGHTFLSAKDASLTINTLALLRGAILIKKVNLKDADAYLYTDSTGYTNGSVFKKSGKDKPAGSGGSFPELDKLALKNVTVTIDKRDRAKLYKFKANELQGKMNNHSNGWTARAYIDIIVHSLAFNTVKGSFIKDRNVKGNLDLTYDSDSGHLNFKRNHLKIGDEDFRIKATFDTNSPQADFTINIENKKIKWRNASHLLSPNISRKLDMFDIRKPISVKCDLVGGLNIHGDPLIRVNAEAKNNELHTPGGIVSECSFFGVFTNENVEGKGYDDVNSAIKLYNFKGKYSDIPFVMKKAFILNLEQPIASGHFNSDFDITKLKSLIDDDLIKFASGKAMVNLDFTANIENFRFVKPIVSGLVTIQDAGITYVPRNLTFKNIDVALNFTSDDLNIDNIHLHTNKSEVQMKGHVKNFLNLYYTAPEKVVVEWSVHSPHLHLGEFIGFAGNRKKTAPKSQTKRKGNFTEELNTLFDKSSVQMRIHVDKLYHNKFFAQDAKAELVLSPLGLNVKNAALKHADGYLQVSGLVREGMKTNNYNVNAVITNVNINKFFTAFDNFGMQALTSDNIRGSLSSKINLSGRITDAGAMIPKSMTGLLAFTLKHGKLLNFEPVRNVGRLAFPNRDMNTISFSNLNGKFEIKGDKINIHPMQVNSSVLNMDISGVYSFGAGTGIFVDVPIRNPKRDEGITDEKELAKRRNRGIVLHLVAEDDKDGKVKVKLGRKRKI